MEPEKLKQFAQSVDVLVVLEEKRSVLESQVKSILYTEAGSPQVIGKQAGDLGSLKEYGELTIAGIAQILAGILGIKQKAEDLMPKVCAPLKVPSFCSGCPHSTSTRTPEGAVSTAGVGCHFLAIFQNPDTKTLTHMGGEGITRMGITPFTSNKHAFINLGDGTYFHSGILAIRQAVAAKLPITYKILFNGAVAMTGGQPIDGDLTVPRLIAQLKAEGVSKICLVSENPEQYTGQDLGVPVYPRHESMQVQTMLQQYPSTSVLIYEQLCATEKRRRRKRGTYPEKNIRVVINPELCEGCGDCSKESWCLSIQPLETELGIKRQIDQTTCNKDLSCLKGFCPAMVTVENGNLRKRLPALALLNEKLPDPASPTQEEVLSVLITGIGGTGVLTSSALLAMACHLGGKQVSVSDMSGMAQKYGAVTSHVKIWKGSDRHSPRIKKEGADVLLGGDLIVSASSESLEKLKNNCSGLVSTGLSTTVAFTHDPDWKYPLAEMTESIHKRGGTGIFFLDMQSEAFKIFGDSIYANTMILGFAMQKGWLPVTLESLNEAIELNRTFVLENKLALHMGRKLAVQSVRAELPQAVRQDPAKLEANLVQRLAQYGNGSELAKFQAMIVKYASSSEQVRCLVALQYFRVLAVKDEFEVARSHLSVEMASYLNTLFEPGYTLSYYFENPWGAGSPEYNGKSKFGKSGHWLLAGLNRAKQMRYKYNPFANRSDHQMNRVFQRIVTADLNHYANDKEEAESEKIKYLESVAKVRGYGKVREKAFREFLSARKSFSCSYRK